ncbi:MAG: hypothetical protein PHD81_03015 [Candidatus Nanoarchaeia archaeon]|nr:hypothetical protein [Candidatus Nanoarchaeia archaeon]MDD5588055.1 hypothetical protein [Candidatus Nanoarchaeia archaeon]
MEKQEIFKLHKKGIIEYSIVDLHQIMTDMLRKNYSFPMVIKNYSKCEKDWTLFSLKPNSTSDRLTIENYLDGMSKISKLLSQEKRPDWVNTLKGDIKLSGIDAPHYSEDGTLITCVRLGNEGYSCTLYIQNKSDTYTAYSETHQNHLEQFMNPHLGPNLTHFKLTF